MWPRQRHRQRARLGRRYPPQVERQGRTAGIDSPASDHRLNDVEDGGEVGPHRDRHRHAAGAAAYVRDPAPFACARVTAWVGDDALLPWFGGGPALLVAQQAGLPASATASAQVLYCDVVRIRVDQLFP